MQNIINYLSKFWEPNMVSLGSDLGKIGLFGEKSLLPMYCNYDTLAATKNQRRSWCRSWNLRSLSFGCRCRWKSHILVQLIFLEKILRKLFTGRYHFVQKSQPCVRCHNYENLIRLRSQFVSQYLSNFNFSCSFMASFSSSLLFFIVLVALKIINISLKVVFRKTTSENIFHGP